jgi:hypothetical protein
VREQAREAAADEAWRAEYEAACAGACGCDANPDAEAILHDIKRRRHEHRSLPENGTDAHP